MVLSISDALRATSRSAQHLELRVSSGVVGRPSEAKDANVMPNGTVQRRAASAGAAQEQCKDSARGQWQGHWQWQGQWQWQCNWSRIGGIGQDWDED